MGLGLGKEKKRTFKNFIIYAINIYPFPHNDDPSCARKNPYSLKALNIFEKVLFYKMTKIFGSITVFHLHNCYYESIILYNYIVNTVTIINIKLLKTLKVPVMNDFATL